jgi:hypothetical protein
LQLPEVERYFRNATACFTCFIRLRSGIPTSLKNNLSQPRPPPPRNYHAIMATAWSIGFHLAMAASGAPAASAAL